MAEKTAALLMDDPMAYFERSVTRMHGIPRGELEALQRTAMGRRFAEHRASIEIVRKLADRLGIDGLHDFDDVVPMLFPHTVFKSYPASLRKSCARLAGYSEQNLREFRQNMRENPCKWALAYEVHSIGRQVVSLWRGIAQKPNNRSRKR